MMIDLEKVSAGLEQERKAKQDRRNMLYAAIAKDSAEMRELDVELIKLAEAQMKIEVLVDYNHLIGKSAIINYQEVQCDIPAIG